jgi:hypothetical protein
MVLHKKETKEHIWILALCAGAIAISLFFSVNEDGNVCFLWLKQYPMPETCFFRIVVGINCPFCGMTRSFISMSHLNFKEAWDFNSVGIFIYAFIFLQIPYRSAIILKRRLRTEAIYGQY